MSAAIPTPQLIARLQEALSSTKNANGNSDKSASSSVTQAAPDRRDRRHRGGANAKMDSAEDYVPKHRVEPAPTPSPAAPAEVASKTVVPDLSACQAALHQRMAQSLQQGDGLDAIDAIDAQTELADNYGDLARHALAQGAWDCAQDALSRGHRLRRPRGEELEEWRCLLATACLGQGDEARATKLLQQNSAHPDDVREAWRTMAGDFKAWKMPALAARARALGGQQAQANRATLLEALRAGDSAAALANRVDLTPQQRAAYEALLQAFPEASLAGDPVS